MLSDDPPARSEGDVPIERMQGAGATPQRELQVVDRDAFALELAREWVRTGIPRNPVK